MKKLNTLIIFLTTTSSLIFSLENNYTLSPIIGQVSPFGENLRSNYEPGFCIGLGLGIPKNVNDRPFNIPGLRI